MSAMTDPMNALVSLQEAILGGFPTNPCELDPKLRVIMDQPNGRTRFSYAKIQNNVVEALSLFAAVEPIEGIPCFAVGYAVNESHRNKGLAKEVLEKGIVELRNGLGRNGVLKFYLETIVGIDNIPSQVVARKIISKEFEQIIDSVSGEDAYRYLRLVECP